MEDSIASTRDSVEETRDETLEISPRSFEEQNNSAGNESEEKKIFDDNPFSVHNTFYIRDHSESDLISTLNFSKQIVCIGTITGMLYKLDSLGSAKNLKTKHTTKITCILIEGNTIISSCEKGIIFVQSLDSEFDDVVIDLGNEIPINCMRVKGELDLNNIQLILGTTSGQVIFYSKGWLTEKIVDLHKDEKKDPITSLSYCDEIIAWSNKNDIKIKDIKKGTKLGLVVRPDLPEDTPNKKIKQTAVPYVMLKPKKKGLCIFAISWIYMLRIYAISRKDDQSPAKIQKIHEFLLDPVKTYLCGFTFIDENFLFLEFMENEPYKPYYIVYSEENKLLFKESIKQAEIYTKYSGIHYKTSTIKNHPSDGQCILYNPETVFQIQPITLKERVLYLYTKKRLNECLYLVNENQNSLPEDLVLKVWNAHLDHLVREKQFEKAHELIPKYCGGNYIQWKHWIMLFKNKKALCFLVEIVPVGDPIKLPPDLYELIFREFLKISDFGNLLICAERFKAHLLDYTKISKTLYDTYIENNELIMNSLFFKTLLLVTEYIDNKEGLFLLFLKSKNDRAFDLLQEPGMPSTGSSGVEINLESKDNHILDLISISPSKAVEYFRDKERNEQGFITKLIPFLQQNSERDLHNFLHHLHLRDNIMSVSFNHLQPRLYIKYDQKSLLSFLKSTSQYNFDEVLKLCNQHKLLEEIVYILKLKDSNSDEILQILINELGDFKQAIEYVFTKQIGNKDLWDSLFVESQKNTEYLAMLLRYIEYYSQPETLIEAIPQGTELKEVRDTLIEAFQQIKLQLGILDNFKLCTKNELLLARSCQINHAFSGEVINEGQCRYCHEPLIDLEMLQEIKSAQPVKLSSRRRLEIKNLTTEMSKLSIITFPNCGHIMHLKCLPSHRNCIFAQKEH
ncbi:unnamed protein product [Moneuplotes crassus]|uniref:Vps41 beta-propeller domain-containing protein n=2 Tax=Euplotes crassus TaxID=5936 RepID=A0AAD2D7T8_EUPCR|nr:unnamed protein product [Moneuplotes crassus]